MGKQYDAFILSTMTTGSGIAIGTDIDVAGIVSGTATTTVTLKSGATTVIFSTGAGVQFCAPAALSGVVTGTSSGGSFAVLYRKRTV
jgi:hypothetical protein